MLAEENVYRECPMGSGKEFELDLAVCVPHRHGSARRGVNVGRESTC